MIRFHDLEWMKTMKVTLRIERCWRYSKVQRRPSVDGKADGFRFLRTGLHLQRRTSADGKADAFRCIRTGLYLVAFCSFILLHEPFVDLIPLMEGKSLVAVPPTKQEPADNTGRDGAAYVCAIFDSWLKKHVKSRPPCPNAVLIDGHLFRHPENQVERC